MSLLRCYPKTAEGVRREDLPVLEIDTQESIPDDFDFGSSDIQDMLNLADENASQAWQDYQTRYGSVFGFDVVLANPESSDTEALWLMIPDADCKWEYIIWLILACNYADTEPTCDVAELAWYIQDEGSIREACRRMDFFAPGQDFKPLDDMDQFEFNNQKYVVG